MKQNWLCAGAAVIALGVGLSAQAPSQGQPTTGQPATQAPTTQPPPGTQRPETQTPSSSSRAGEERTMTLSGCLMAAPTSSPSGTPGAVGTAGSGSFILTNARPSTTPSPESSGGARTPGASTPGATPEPATPGATSPGARTSPGTPASPPSTAGAQSSSSTSAGMTYSLEGQSSQLKDHVGHQVEVTGRLNQSSSSSSSPTSRDADRDSAARDNARPSSSTPMSRFEVQSVKMIAASCRR